MSPIDPAGNEEPEVARDDRSLIKSALGSAFPEAEITEWRMLPSTGSHAVAAVSLADGERYVLKCAGDDGAVDCLDRELAVTTFVQRATDVPVADVVRSDLKQTTDSPAFLITRWVKGPKLETLLDSASYPTRVDSLTDLGETLALLHEQTSLDRFGDLVSAKDEEIAVDPADSWAEQFVTRLADQVVQLQGTRFEGLAEEIWNEIAPNATELETGAGPVVVHGDIGPENVVYDGSTVKCLLDWEFAFAGHPEYDLCRAEIRCFWNSWGEQTSQGSAIYSGYRSQRELPDGFQQRRQYYLATFYLRSLTNFERWGPEMSADPDEFAVKIAEKIRAIID